MHTKGAHHFKLIVLILQLPPLLTQLPSAVMSIVTVTYMTVTVRDTGSRRTCVSQCTETGLNFVLLGFYRRRIMQRKHDSCLS